MSNNSQMSMKNHNAFLPRCRQILLCLLLCYACNATAQGLITEQLTPLPAIEKGEESLGYAGMYGGKVGDLILAMGGANFPDALPWQGGTKVWSDHIFILQDQKWKRSKNKLPSALGYVASITLDNGILCIGGNN